MKKIFSKREAVWKTGYTDDKIRTNIVFTFREHKPANKKWEIEITVSYYTSFFISNLEEKRLVSHGADALEALYSLRRKIQDAGWAASYKLLDYVIENREYPKEISSLCNRVTNSTILIISDPHK